jgi:hypothetical protein
MQATTALRQAPPCTFGAGHTFCAANEPGCSLAQSRSVGGGEPAAPGSAVQRWRDSHAPAVASMHLFSTQRTPLGKVSALRAALRCVAAVAHVEGNAVSERKRTQRAAASGGLLPFAASSDGAGRRTSSEDTHGHVGHGVGADDLVPRICCLLVQSGVPGLLPQVAYLEDTLPDDVACGEEGYTLVTLRAAISVVQHMAKDRSC